MYEYYLVCPQEEYMEYHRYLKEVVQALESDPDFRERLEKADEEDVRVRRYFYHPYVKKRDAVSLSAC